MGDGAQHVFTVLVVEMVRGIQKVAGSKNHPHLDRLHRGEPPATVHSALSRRFGHHRAPQIGHDSQIVAGISNCMTERPPHRRRDAIEVQHAVDVGDPFCQRTKKAFAVHPGHLPPGCE